MESGNADGSQNAVVLLSLLNISQGLLIQPSCPVCRQPLPGDLENNTLCEACRQRLELPPGGCQGHAPLSWRGLGFYRGEFRRILLKQKLTPTSRVLKGLIGALRATLPSQEGKVLVPIPSWKRRNGNSLPAQIAQELGASQAELLQRKRAGIGQHHLGRHQRQGNQHGAFQSPPCQHPLTIWLVDDIVTTGATAIAAKQALQSAGHQVEGVICLGRTPSVHHRR